MKKYIISYSEFLNEALKLDAGFNKDFKPFTKTATKFNDLIKKDKRWEQIHSESTAYGPSIDYFLNKDSHLIAILSQYIGKTKSENRGYLKILDFNDPSLKSIRGVLDKKLSAKGTLKLAKRNFKEYPNNDISLLYKQQFTTYIKSGHIFYDETVNNETIVEINQFQQILDDSISYMKKFGTVDFKKFKGGDKNIHYKLTLNLSEPNNDKSEERDFIDKFNPNFYRIQNAVPTGPATRQKIFTIKPGIGGYKSTSIEFIASLDLYTKFYKK